MIRVPCRLSHPQLNLRVCYVSMVFCSLKIMKPGVETQGFPPLHQHGNSLMLSME